MFGWLKENAEFFIFFVMLYNVAQIIFYKKFKSMFIDEVYDKAKSFNIINSILFLAMLIEIYVIGYSFTVNKIVFLLFIVSFCIASYSHSNKFVNRIDKVDFLINLLAGAINIGCCYKMLY